METIRTLRLMGFWWTFFSGHISFWKFCIFGQNAMHWSLNIYDTPWGHIHIDLPTWSRIAGKRGWKIYTSPNGTPWACTWCIGTDKKENARAAIRRIIFGHNNTEAAKDYREGSRLYQVNAKMDELFWL